MSCFLLSDLSEQIKAATKDSHVRAENTQLMLNYQKGQITQTQYKVNLYNQYMVLQLLDGIHIKQKTGLKVMFLTTF